MNSEYKEKIKKIFNGYQFELANKTTLEKVHSDVIFYLYENGYNGDYSSDNFKPLILDINYKLSIEVDCKTPYLQLELLDDGKWYVFN
jgi:hypothetical protein